MCYKWLVDPDGMVLGQAETEPQELADVMICFHAKICVPFFHYSYLFRN